MTRFSLKPFAFVLLSGALLGFTPARGQEASQPSVAEAARKAREQKKYSAKPAMVVTNDTLEPPAPVQVGIATGSPKEQPVVSTDAAAPGADANATAANPNAATTNANAAASSATPETAATEAKPAAPTKEEMDAKQQEMEALKQQYAAMQAEVKLMERELSLENDNYYSKMDHDRDAAGKAKLDELKAALEQQRAALAALKDKLGDALPPDAAKAPLPPAPGLRY